MAAAAAATPPPTPAALPPASPLGSPTSPPGSKLVLKPLDDARVVEKLRVLDRYFFPVRYTEKYYSSVVLHNLSQLAFFNELLVGSCTCRLEPLKDAEQNATATAAAVADPPVFRLYVMTIGVLEPYRRLRIGSQLMERVMANAAGDPSHRIDHIALHVQVGSSALAFYQSLGFAIQEEVKDYYTELDVNDALLLTKPVAQPHFAAGKKGPKGGKAALGSHKA